LVQVTRCCPPHSRSSFVSPGPFGTSHKLLSSSHKVVFYLTWAFWYKSLAAVLHPQGRPLSRLGLLVQVTRCCPSPTRSPFVSPGPFGTSHSLPSSKHKGILCLTWAFWYKSLIAVLHTQGRLLSNLDLLVQVTRWCPCHTWTSLSLNWTFWCRSLVMSFTQGRLLSHPRFAKLKGPLLSLTYEIVFQLSQFMRK
jgi:hypothetical protein